MAEEQPALTVLVMDPLALPLSCPCVKGHAQRLYDKLVAHLEKQLGQPVKVLFSDDLSKVLRSETKEIDVIIGKQSVVRFDAKINKLEVRPAMMLTGRGRKDDGHRADRRPQGRSGEDARRSEGLYGLLRAARLRRKVQGRRRGLEEGRNRACRPRSRPGPAAAIRWSRCWSIPRSRRRR